MPEVKCPECRKFFKLPINFPPALLEKFKVVCPKCLRKHQKEENIAPPYQGSGNKVGKEDKEVKGNNSWKYPPPDLPY